MKTSLQFNNKNIFLFLLVLFSLLLVDLKAQYLPDLIYYKFDKNPSATSVRNFAYPGVGLNPASITGLTMTTGGQFDSCLYGNATTSAGINTGYSLSTGTSSFTISMWISNIPTAPASTRYLFGDLGLAFRCFIGGVAGNNNIILRGTGVTDVLIKNIAPGPTILHIVYDSASSSIKTYKNGIADTVVTQTAFNFTSGTGLKVGGYSTSAGMQGIMDEFRFYKRALTASEISASYNIPVEMPEYYNLCTGANSNSYPFNTAGGKAVNSLIRTGEINQPTVIPSGQQITKVYFRTSTAGTRTYTNLHILIAQCSDTSLTSGTFYSGPYDTVYYKSSVSLTSYINGWMGINLDVPYVYDPSKSIILFVGQCGASGSGGSVRNTALTGTGTRRVYSVGGCPFVASSGDASIINFGVDVETAPPMSGTYYVGSDKNCPNFKTITNAIYNLNIRGVSGAVTFILTDTSYSSETLPITINQITGASLLKTIIIKPNTGVTSKISGSSVTSVIKLNGADFVTIDGSNSCGTDKNLTIQNTNASSGTAAIWLASLGAGLGASNNTIKNCNISCNYNTGTSYGICLGGTTLSSTGADNDTVTIQNNTISKSYYGIRAYGSSAGELNSILITGNTIGSDNSSDYITTYGIYGYYLSGPTITNNEIYNLIFDGSRYGMYLGSNVYNSIISKNKIHGFNHTNTTAYYCIGIYFSSGTNCTNNQLDNNAIYDLQNYGSTTDYYYCGIRIAGGSNYKLYYNSISLTGAFRNTTAGVFSKCLYISTASTNLDIRNNIFYNAMTGTTPKTFAIDIVAPSTFSSCNYNNLYSATDMILGRYAGVEHPNLYYWQTATSQDYFSVSANPGFTSGTDLSIITLSVNCWNINGGAYPLAGITTDIEGNPRSSTLNTGAADIGAYEFTPIVSAPGLTVTGLPADELYPTYITYAGTTLAEITWHGSNLPFNVISIYRPQVNPPSPAGNYANEYFMIAQVGGSGFTYDIIVHYNLARQFTITSEADIRLAKQDGSWIQYDAAPNTTNKTITITGLNSFSNFSFGDANNPLPVNMKSFTSNINGRNVKLKWLTEKEQNNKGFEIQRVNANNPNTEFSKIGFVNSYGNNQNQNVYSFDDIKLNAGKYNYRLKQIDNNGNYTYYNLSTTIEIALPKEFKLSQNYPNPFNPITKIDYELPFDSKIRIVVYDILGREVKNLISGESKQAGYYTVELNATNLSSGTYFYRMIVNTQGKDFIFTKKMIVIK